MNEKEISIKSTDGIVLNALISKVSDNKKVVILCHGITANKEECGMFTKLTSELRNYKINSLRFDFRGHGKSTGNDYEMTPTKEAEDVKSVMKYVTELGYNEIVILGASFGAGAISLVDYSQYKEVKAIIDWYGAIDYLKSTVSYWDEENRKIANEKGYVELKGKSFRLGKTCINEIYSLKPYENLAKVNLPILFLHGTKDEKVPHQISLDASKKCKNARIELIENAGHGFLDSKETMEQAIKITVDFIKEQL